MTMERALVAAGLPHIRILDLRHGYASLANVVGAAMKAAAETPAVIE